ncbi:4-hydroxyphenylpyruvate dioxygenase [Corallococcus sp. H22C18031201]|uniref:4-hydroxyphenylpyruvate dioxygenase n=1 Tax=Citreicoccus inhibens TaxID=2849499 RepID=UPI000E755E4D|nr:4-hydroxyphenylpyruvate dioxygenase [Citreicoccus inhibens]MBU8895321.1 4-hydroxyphenylpyruvate dioxygenase [Citreicoccus inhibens]RJS22634.1 4-hydroxyphenylpyruvate dioxygenase [Corallococcus sp. H22C18031201]
MAITPENPLGLDGFEFVEFTGPAPEVMVQLLERLGFTANAKHPTKDLIRYKQGDINLLINREPTGQAAEFRSAHGPSASGMAFRVENARAAYELALERGAKAADPSRGALGQGSYVLEGIGGSLLYLVDRYGPKGSIYDAWQPIPGAVEAEARNNVGLETLDHLTHNVRRGQMRTWSTFYNRIFGFTEQKYFDIKGQATGLFSQAMIAPDRAIRIPLNESQDDKSQIEEFIRQYNGEGIQHLALTTPDIYGTVERLRARGVALQDTLDAYYDLVDKRVPNHGEDLARMRKNRILIDGNEKEGLLMQIFTENLFGPIFFEIIQRKGNEGFGNGNFQALFESIELDQIRRGVIKVDPAR